MKGMQITHNRDSIEPISHTYTRQAADKIQAAVGDDEPKGGE